MYDRIASITGYGREEVKPLFLAVIYGRPGDMYTTVGKAIRRLYPTVFDAVADLNRRLGHGGLPRQLQRLESRVMIDRVAARLVLEHPAVPLLTVHDSVLVPPEYDGLAEAVVVEEWRAEFGVVPRMKTSAFTAPQEPREKRGHVPRRRLERAGGSDVGHPDSYSTA